jgi:hypothetical protein
MPSKTLAPGRSLIPINFAEGSIEDGEAASAEVSVGAEERDEVCAPTSVPDHSRDHVCLAWTPLHLSITTVGAIFPCAAPGYSW